MIHLSTPDILVILIYFGAVLFIGFRSAVKTSSDPEDFLLAGRSLTLPIFVMTLVSTWYGGILGVGEFSYRYGISNWIVQGVPYYIFAGIFAATLAKKIQSTRLFSIPDKLELAYDRKTAILGSVLTFILTTPAPYVLMISVFIQMLFGLDLMSSLAITAVVALSYLYWGGFRADIQTDVFEFFLMFGGFAIIVPFCYGELGGFEYLQNNLPSLHLSWHGGNSIQYIFVWFFIALWTLIDPAFHQRCYAAKDGNVARKGIFISILFWLIFDFLTATAGLYARASIPNLSDPMMAYPMLAESILPPVAKGLFYVGMLATIMSTLNTLAFISAQTIGRDIIGRLKTPKTEIGAGQQLTVTGSTKWTRIGLIITIIFSVIIAVIFPSVVKIWYTIGTLVVPGLLVPVVASYFERLHMTSRYAFLAMSCSWAASTCWFIAGVIPHSPVSYPLNIEPMYIGLSVSLIIWVIGRYNYPHLKMGTTH
jgi:SSS family solute:Na+ symporter